MSRRSWGFTPGSRDDSGRPIWQPGASGYDGGVNDTTTRDDKSGFNFWQWIGLILLVIALVWFLWDNFASPDHDPQPTTLPADEATVE